MIDDQSPQGYKSVCYDLFLGKKRKVFFIRVWDGIRLNQRKYMYGCVKAGTQRLNTMVLYTRFHKKYNNLKKTINDRTGSSSHKIIQPIYYGSYSQQLLTSNLIKHLSQWSKCCILSWWPCFNVSHKINIFHLCNLNNVMIIWWNSFS